MKTNSITRKFGKLMRLDVTYADYIESLKITGDFSYTRKKPSIKSFQN